MHSAPMHMIDLQPQALPRARGIAAFRPDPLPPEQIRALLTAAFGQRQSACWGRAAPAADSIEEIVVYAVRPGGAYRYDRREQRMHLARAGDLRSVAGMRELLAAAPLVLVYVKDEDAVERDHAEEHGVLAFNHADCLADNVERGCARAGLASVLHSPSDSRRLAHALGLKATERVLHVQSVGYPGPTPH